MMRKPHSLFTRFTLIIIVPILLLCTIAIYIFHQRHLDNISRTMQNILVDEVFIALKAINADDYETPQLLNFTIAVKSMLLPKTSPKYKTLVRKLEGKLQHKVSVIAEERERILHIWIEDNNQVIQISCPLKRLESNTAMLFIAWLIGSSVIVILIAMVFMRNQLQAIHDLLMYADKLGKGQEVGKLKVAGAQEVRRLSHSFIKMKNRIARQVQYRSDLLTHISHDLRTPLTRINLAAEMLKDDYTKHLIANEVNEMNYLITNYLQFAQEEGVEKSIQFSFEQLLQELQGMFPSVEFTFPDATLVVNLRYRAIYRAIRNILENANKYKNHRVLCKVCYHSDTLEILVEDDGIGIPKKMHSKVFKPFEKLGSDKDGFGLGMAIAKSIIYSHGGRIKLGTSSIGGLLVVIHLPL